MPDEESKRARAVRLLTEAVGSLPEEDRQLVVGYLLERALLGPARSSAGSEEASRAGTLVPRPMGEDWAARAARLLLSGRTVQDVAELYGAREDGISAAFRDVASRPDTPERLSSVLLLLADGRTGAEAAEELGLSPEEVDAEIERLLPSPAARRLGGALQASSVLTQLEVPVAGLHASGGAMAPASAFGAATSGGRGEQRMFPVRLPDAQYRRLKEWCSAHGFAMAVVVRGLVERFLDEQDRRAA